MITVLLATWNGEQYLKEQMDSLLQQTDPEFSILISDDGSTDRTPFLIKEYETRYPKRISSLKISSPTGSARDNFYRLIKASSDEYLMFCDQDDIWLPDKVETTKKEMERMEEKWGKDMPILVHSDLLITDQNGSLRCNSMARYQKIAVNDNRTSHYLVENNITGCTMMINKSLQTLLEPLPENGMMHDWWIGLVASCFGKISYINRPLIKYRQHGGNQVGARSGTSQLLERTNNRKRIKDNYLGLFDQANAFLTVYGSSMSPDQKELFEAFLSIKDKNRAGKIRVIWNYKLFKSTPMRTLGQMLFI